MIEVNYLKESEEHDKKTFAKKVQLLLNDGWTLTNFNTYGQGGGYSGGSSVALFTREKKEKEMF